MAVDEFLFRSLDDRTRTYLRFYQWERPTASLGYTQNTAKVVDLEFCRRNGIDVVRRITGGKLVLHHREITYAVVSSDADTFSGTLAGSYKLISRALMRGLELMGLSPTSADKAPLFYAKSDLPCFSHPAQDEIEISGKKLIGSAQKRVGTGFLQHGSVPLGHDERLLKSVSLLREDAAEIRMTSLSEALGRPVEFGWAVERIVAGFKEYFHIDLEPLVLSSRDIENVQAIEKDKYNSEEWTLHGRSL